MDEKARRLFAKICGLMGSAHAGERAEAAVKATERLRAAGLTWADVHVGKPEVVVQFVDRFVDRDRVVARAPSPEEITAWVKEHPEALFWPHMGMLSAKLERLKTEVAELEERRRQLRRRPQKERTPRQAPAEAQQPREGPTYNDSNEDDPKLRAELEAAIAADERGDIELPERTVEFIESILSHSMWSDKQRIGVRKTLGWYVRRAWEERTIDGQAAH